MENFEALEHFLKHKHLISEERTCLSFWCIGRFLIQVYIFRWLIWWPDIFDMNHGYNIWACTYQNKQKVSSTSI